MPNVENRRTLSDLVVAKVNPKAARFEMPDSVVPGLRLIVQPSGVKSWAVRTRINRKPVKLTLGRFDEKTLGVTAARERARTALGDPHAFRLQSKAPAPLSLPAPAAAEPVAVQADPPLALPASPSTDDPAPGSVGAVWADYVAKHLEATAKPSTIARFKGLFKKNILPGWRDRSLASIVKADCLAVIDAAQTRGPEARNSTIVVLSSFFVWALGRDLITASPLTGIKKTEPTNGERALNNAEIKIFWEGCDKLGPIFGPMFQLMLLTGARRSEVSGMRYDELVLDARLWIIPGSRTKNGDPLAVFLTDQMLAVLNSMPRIEGSAFVFSRYGHSPSSGFSKAKLELDKLAPISPDYTLHDLRRTFVTGAKKLGVSATIIEKCVNHSSGTLAGVAGIYDVNDYIEEKTAAWKLWNDHLSSLLTDHSTAAVSARS